MSRGVEYQFIPTDPEDIIVWLTTGYEETTGTTVQPGSSEQLIIRWAAEFIVLERVMTNYAANQNIPSRAVGANLDALAEMYYGKERPQAKAATCTVRFTISEPQTFAVLVPKGTRVTDVEKTLVWETLEDVYFVRAISKGKATLRICQRATSGKHSKSCSGQSNGKILHRS